MNDIEPTSILGILAITYFVCYLLYILYYAIGLYDLNPFVKPHELTNSEISFLNEIIIPIKNLNVEQREELYKRTAWFYGKKKFVFHGNVEQKNRLELLVSASASLLTLGMKNYKWIKSINRIIVYPTKYYSKIRRQHHLGEYNPSFKILVFAGDMLQEGFGIPNDNLNLAIHELAHALCFETKGRATWEARKFQVGLRRISTLFKNNEFQEKLKASNYFRVYGQTNIFEFIAVLFESYLETPSIFKREFPELYDIVRKMLNIDYLNPNWRLRIKT